MGLKVAVQMDPIESINRQNVRKSQWVLQRHNESPSRKLWAPDPHAIASQA